MSRREWTRRTWWVVARMDASSFEARAVFGNVRDAQRGGVSDGPEVWTVIAECADGEVAERRAAIMTRADFEKVLTM